MGPESRVGLWTLGCPSYLGVEASGPSSPPPGLSTTPQTAPGSHVPSSPWPSAAGKQPVSRGLVCSCKCVSVPGHGCREAGEVEAGRGLCPRPQPAAPGALDGSLGGGALVGSAHLPSQCPEPRPLPRSLGGARPSTPNLSGAHPPATSGRFRPKQRVSGLASGLPSALSVPPGHGHSPHLPPSPRSPGTWPELVGHRPDGGLQDRVTV